MKRLTSVLPHALWAVLLVGAILLTAAAANKASKAEAPADLIAYVDAFCRTDVAYIAAHTQMMGVDQSLLETYFANDPVICTSYRYLGTLTDSGATRYIFVLSYPDGRSDYVVLTWTGDSLTDFRRG